MSLLFPGAPQLLGNPKSLGLLSSLRVPALQAPPRSLWNCSSQGIPSALGGSGSSAPALPGFCHFRSCCCNKKWERHRLPLPPAPGGVLPFLGRLGQDWGGVLSTNSAIMAKSRMRMCRVWPRQGPFPKSLRSQQWGGTGGAPHWSCTGSPKGAPKPWDNPQQGMWGAFPFPIPFVGAGSSLV